MSDPYDRDEDLEPWITTWEQQCIQEVESAPDLEVQLQSEKDSAAQKQWFLFQNAATFIAQLYKDRQHGVTLWVPFQNAASSVTNLYKECLESQKRFADLGFQCGYQRRTKDVLAWAKKRKRHIRKEDLIAFLTGKNPPPHRHWSSPRQRLSLEGVRTPPHHLSHGLSHPRLPFTTSDPQPFSSHDTDEADLQTFREALALSSLGSGVPAGSLGCRQHMPGSPPSSHSRGHRMRSCGQSTASLTELNTFITEEFVRHVESLKRAPSTDVIMDSPTHKRSRLT